MLFYAFSVQFSHSVLPDSLWLQDTRLPCLSPTPRVCSNSSPLSPHSPSPTASFFVLKSKTLWKRCLYLLSLLSHLFPLCIITISVIVIIVVTKSVLLFWSQGCKGLSYSYCSACEYHLHCGQGPFMLYFALHPSSLLSTLLSLSTTCTHKFVLLEYLNVHYFLKTILLYSIKNQSCTILT